MGDSSDPEDKQPGDRQRRRRLLYFVAVAAGVLLGFLGMTAFARMAPAGLWGRVAGFVAAGAPSRVRCFLSNGSGEDSPTLAYLETVEYSLDKIVEGERESAYLPDFLAGENLLLVAHGEVIAGVDLSQMKAGDVVVNGDAVHAPAARGADSYDAHR